MATVMSTTITRPDGSTKTENHRVVVGMDICPPEIPPMDVSVAQHIAEAKKIIKDGFGIDIEVEFVKDADLDKRMAEFEKQYGEKAEEFGGLFSPGRNGLPPIIVVGYDPEQPLGFVEIYCHELQHAIDYFELVQSLGKEFVDENFVYYLYFTEFNASRIGVFQQTRAYLQHMPNGERQAYIDDCKAQAKKVFAKWEQRDIIDVLSYLARFAVFAKLEGKQDDTMLAIVPQLDKFIDILNLINRYQPTKEWYAEFKKLIDGLTVKKK